MIEKIDGKFKMIEDGQLVEAEDGTIGKNADGKPVWFLDNKFVPLEEGKQYDNNLIYEGEEVVDEVVFAKFQDANNGNIYYIAHGKSQPTRVKIGNDEYTSTDQDYFTKVGYENDGRYTYDEETGEMIPLNQDNSIKTDKDGKYYIDEDGKYVYEYLNENNKYVEIQEGMIGEIDDKFMVIEDGKLVEARDRTFGETVDGKPVIIQNNKAVPLEKRQRYQLFPDSDKNFTYIGINEINGDKYARFFDDSHNILEIQAGENFVSRIKTVRDGNYTLTRDGNFRKSGDDTDTRYIYDPETGKMKSLGLIDQEQLNNTAIGGFVKSNKNNKFYIKNNKGNPIKAEVGTIAKDTNGKLVILNGNNELIPVEPGMTGKHLEGRLTDDRKSDDWSWGEEIIINANGEAIVPKSGTLGKNIYGENVVFNDAGRTVTVHPGTFGTDINGNLLKGDKNGNLVKPDEGDILKDANGKKGCEWKIRTFKKWRNSCQS
jgi:hypothetical protein